MGKSVPVNIFSQGDKLGTTNTNFCWEAIADTENKTNYIEDEGKFLWVLDCIKIRHKLMIKIVYAMVET